MEEKQYTLEELKEGDDKLNDSQIKFCHRWIIDYNNVQSYMFAYPDSSYGAAAVSAHDFLRNPKIKQYISFIKEDIAKEAGISVLSQLNALKKIAYSNIAEIYEDWVKLKDFAEIPQEVKDAIGEISYKKHKLGDTDLDVEFVKVKMKSSIEAIKEINKMLGLYEPEKKDIKINGNVTGFLPGGFED